MAQVVNMAEIRALLTDLGWNLDFAELGRWLKDQGVPAASFFAYARAMSRSRNGVDDTDVPGCPPGAGAKITAMLQEKGLVAS